MKQRTALIASAMSITLLTSVASLATTITPPTSNPSCVIIKRGGVGDVPDSEINSLAPSYHIVDGYEVNTGYSTTSGEKRALFGFNLSSIPIGSAVASAKFNVLLNSNTAQTVSINRVIAPWSEATVTWTNFGGIDPTDLATFVSGGFGVWKSVTVTSLVQSWVSGQVPNYGILLKEGNAGKTAFKSSDNLTLTSRPYLEVCYTVPKGSIGNTVWFDANADGIKDASEPGIYGAVVDLFDCGGTKLATTATDQAGAYRFADLSAGCYVVDVDDATLPTGHILTTEAEPLDVALGVGENFADADFGYVTTSSIGDTVWLDSDADGLYEPATGELGVNGVLVELFQGAALIDTTITGFSPYTGEPGFYLFDSLPPGQYTVVVTSDNFTTSGPLAGEEPTADYDGGLDSAALVSLSGGEDMRDADFGYRHSCGNGVCSDDESCSSCAIDCGVCPPACGNGTCETGEDCSSCSADCGACAPACGDGTCDITESCSDCTADCGVCPPVCGDGTCDITESCSSCSADCGACPPVCGNGTCESCSNCASDCGTCPAVCGNGTCESGESCSNCADDCGVCPPVCGNNNCEAGETCSNCGSDCGACPPVCGDGTCAITESCSNCASDCGACPPVCGNGTCENGESCSNCASDCGTCAPVCGNHTCEAGESCSLCPDDCGACPAVCGNHTCETGESCSICPGDCGSCPAVCGNGTCEATEGCSSCPSDCGLCPAVCGSGTCEIGETCSSCSGDCGVCPPVCGDGTCNKGEDCSSCSRDCGACPSAAPGTGTIGYWMNHPTAWPVEQMSIGGKMYTKAQLIAIIKQPTKGDVTYTIAQQLIAAKLNVGVGNESSCIERTIAAADAWLTQNKLGSNVKGGSAAWSTGAPMSTSLDDYNNGHLCAKHRD